MNCPKCEEMGDVERMRRSMLGEGIETVVELEYQEDDPSVGVVGGYECPQCGYMCELDDQDYD
jgi:rubrerythrin